MAPADNNDLALSTDRGSTGIYQLKRLWSKAIAGPGVMSRFPEEALLESTLIDILGIGLLPTYQFLFNERPDFESFENWVIAHSNGHIEGGTIQLCNALFHKQTIHQQNIVADVLSPADIDFWETNGYVIIRNAVTPGDCADSRTAIMDHLQMDEADETSWYKSSPGMQGIMVPLYREGAIDRNRNSPIIKRAFEQLWNRTDLIVTTDKCGFNPPETKDFKYRGIGLHWDVSLATPIPFGTQGILYLIDTAAHQGALTVVPGFHKNLESWLLALPKDANPREVDLSSFNPQPIAANAGDFIIWNHKLPHSASPNRAQLPRIVQYINWYAPVADTNREWV
jgi:hypothetical protein